MIRPKCKKLDCSIPAAISQVYCSRECAPYGYLSNSNYTKKKKPRKSNFAYLQYKEEMIRLIDEGKRLSEIADILKIPYPTLISYRHKMNLPRVGKRKPSETSTNAPGSIIRRPVNQVLMNAISELITKGVSTADIARQLDTSHAHVSYYRKKLSRKSYQV
jgi:DNA-binding NarL/FixJ family response regulator